MIARALGLLFLRASLVLALWILLSAMVTP
jgi:hypothetical protein